MKYEILILIFITIVLWTGCSLKQFYPSAGAIVGGATGSLAGPVGSGLGAGAGALVGEVARGNEEIAEQAETIKALSKGDVEALVAQGMSKHQGLFDNFTSSIKNLLIIAGVLLLCYLFIPVFVARRCSQSEAQKLTQSPFPYKPK